MHGLLIVLVAYVAFDLADPVSPGAFSFEVGDSRIEEAIHVQRHSHDKPVFADSAAPPDLRAEVRGDSLISQRSTLPRPLVRVVPPRRPAPPDEAPRERAQSLDDH